MARYQDLRRVINGVSLVAKEAAEISSGLNMARNGDITGLISSTLKNIVNTATDLTGLTRGSIHQYSENKPNINQAHAPATFEEGSKIEVQNEDTAKFSGQINIEHKNSPVSETFRAGSSSAQEVAVLPEPSTTDNDVKSPEEEVSANPTAESRECVRVLTSGNIPETSSGQIQNVGESPSTAMPLPLKKRRPRERRVPSTPLGRALGFAGLGAGLAWGTFQESAKRLVFGKGDLLRGQSALSPFLSEQNAKRLALALCRMRGAALKLGQMLSIQDESLVPAPISAALEIVRQGADVMPRRQLNHVLAAELGSDWQSKLRSFDYEPMAAASIGQVHKAVTKDGMEVAVKIQYPGVADSIDSDIENVRRILDYTNLIPQGLYLDQAMKVAKEELARECNYELEAANQKHFRNLLSGIEGFYVPLVIEEISSKRVLTTELVSGVPIDKVAQLNQETRDYVGRKLLELTLKELFVFRFMQTDPNWSNFLYDEASNTINLIDFGAARMYSENFVDNYLRMVLACANRDEQNIIKMSQRLGFLTGLESQIMLDAHTQAAFVVGLPFSKTGGFDFGSTNLPKNISHLGATMLKHRLTPPPAEAYSLHRKLSGAFLACIKLQAVVPCREMLLDVYQNYNFSDTEDGLDKTCSATA